MNQDLLAWRTCQEIGGRRANGSQSAGGSGNDDRGHGWGPYINYSAIRYIEICNIVTFEKKEEYNYRKPTKSGKCLLHLGEQSQLATPEGQWDLRYRYSLLAQLHPLDRLILNHYKL